MVAIRAPLTAAAYYAAGLLGAATGGTGCSTNCRGPGCEEVRPAFRVAVHALEASRPGTDPWAGALAWFDGPVPSGADGVVTTQGDALWWGQPAAGRVQSLRYREGQGPYTTLATLEGSDDFGQDLLWRLDELWVSAPSLDFNRGSVTVFRGEDLQLGRPTWVLRGDSPDRLGERLAQCGDLTGDGLPEVAVGMPWASDPVDLAGAVLVVRSEAIALRATAAAPSEVGTLLRGVSEGGLAGSAIACDRDHSGDGRADLVVGAPFAAGTNGADAGRVYLIDQLPDRDGTLEDAAAEVFEGAGESDWLGSAVALLELDGLPPAELVLSAPGARQGEGRVELHAGQGSVRPGSTRQRWEIRPEDGLTFRFGEWLAGGDADGDGRGDLLIGAPRRQPGPALYDAGGAWLFLADTLLREEPRLSDADRTFLGSRPFQRVGRRPLLADLDGDGRDEVILPTRRAPDE